MANKLEVKKKLFAKSDRVKSVDIHPTEPWILSALYSGKVLIWDYKTETLVKSFEVCDQPVRCAKFIPRKQWVVTGSDDMIIRVYNYNTMGKIKAFEAHTDFIRCIAVHPTQPYILSTSDDMLIKLWDWDKNWQCTQVFEGHTHYVMMVTFNPKDPTTFASASLDRTIKVWGLSSPVPNFTLEAHERGVNSVCYFPTGDKPYIVSGGDDRLVKVWDYLNKSCVQVLEGHSHNVTAAVFHPTLPLIISGSEDNTIQVWNANTYKLEKSLSYGMDRVWNLNYLPASNSIAIGYDEGTILVKFGREDPVVSMDSSGKIIWAKQSEIQQVNVKQASSFADGEKLILPSKDLGTSEFFPQILKHSNNGRFVAVCGDGEFIIYTSVAWRNKSFGKGLEFAWGDDTGEYVVRETSSKIKIFKNFTEHTSFRPNYTADGLFGGRLIGVKAHNFLCFYDWDSGRLIRRIEITPKAVHWSKSGDLVVITCDTSFFILKYNHEATLSSPESEDGFEEAFEVLHEVNEKVRSAMWVEDCFIYTTQSRLNYCVAGEVVTLAHIDRTLYPLGYLPNISRVFLIDKSLNITSYSLEITVINYQTAIARGDFDTASTILPKIPFEHRNRIAQFLDARGLKEMALEVATEPELRFELAIQLNKLRTAYELARSADSELRWKQLGDSALINCEYELARECLSNAKDLGSLLLLCTSLGDEAGLQRLAETAKAEGFNNIAFVSYFLLHQLDKCISLLTETKRHAEAAFFARTYSPSKVSAMVKSWKEELKKINPKAAESLADPDEYSNLFPELESGIQIEQFLAATSKKVAAHHFLKYREYSASRNLLEEAQAYLANPQSQEARNEPDIQPSPANETPAVVIVENSASDTSSSIIIETTPQATEPKNASDQEIDDLLGEEIGDIGEEINEDILLEDLE